MAEMTRSSFMKCCALGACSCSLIPLAAATTVAPASGNSEVDALTKQREAIRIRYAKLLGILDEEVDDATRKRIFERLGRACADQFRAITYDMYKNDIRGFLAAIVQPTGWVEKTQYKGQFFLPLSTLWVPRPCALCKGGNAAADTVGLCHARAGRIATTALTIASRGQIENPTSGKTGQKWGTLLV